MWQGTESQKKARKTLEELSLFEDLAEFHPLFAGTIPIDMDVEGSDIDILCEVKDFDRFLKRIKESFETRSHFTITDKFLKSARHMICRFEHNRFRIEIFGQNLPVEQQNGYRHMVVERRLLHIGGETARSAIREKKAKGQKTEPAFADYFGLPGDPYETLLSLYELAPEELEKQVIQMSRPDSTSR